MQSARDLVPKFVSVTLILVLGVLVMEQLMTDGKSGIGLANGSEPGHGRKPIPSPEELKALPKDGGAEYNRLVFEKSPYLLQHAGNPVDWYPWGKEAFEKAKRENKPVFLSIGYTTCHWCHVMERESFEDDEVGALLNKYFVCVKVDREERPDVDHLYMTVTQAMTGGGGWPMTVALTPDKKPFFAGTYYPKHSRPGRPGMMELIPRLAEAWNRDRDKILEHADNVTEALARLAGGAPGDKMGAETLDTAYRQLAERFDSEHGGFGREPKFPTAHNLSFLLRYWKRTGKAKALEMVEKTLLEIRLGGVYDHVGLGVHRYSTDREWLLPHFEKMLYDQALLAIANIEAHQATGKETYARTAREIFTYVLRDMTSPEGGFYSAEDADSEGEEGRFYVWRPEEIREILGKEEGGLFTHVHNIVEGGNFRDQAAGKMTGDSIPHLKLELSEMAKQLHAEESTLRSRLDGARQKLFAAREKRIHPQKDDKILTDWNGLMIAALAKGAQALNAPEYGKAAQRAAEFVLGKLRGDGGRLLKRYRGGEAGLPALIEDYAFMVWGLLELYEATFDVRYLQEGIALNDAMLEHFWDEEEGGFFMSADDAEELLVRSKEVYDGAIPSGNSVAALNLIRLSRVTGKAAYEERAAGIMKAFSGTVAGQASAHTQLMVALDFLIGPSYEVVVAGETGAEDTTKMLAALRRPFVPNKVVLFRPAGVETPPISGIAPYTKAQTRRDGAATVYVCRDFTCQAPTTDVRTVLRSLEVRE